MYEVRPFNRRGEPMIDLLLPYIVEFDTFGKPQLGFLTIADEQLPFKPQRLYWIYDTPDNAERGGHAHKENKNTLICIQGVVIVSLEDCDGNQLDFVLDNPSKGLFIPAGYWLDFKLSNQAILLCTASMSHDPEDYIRDKDEFLNQ